MDEDFFRACVYIRSLPVISPQVNRDPSSAEVARLRQQLQLIQAELLCCQAAGGGDSQVSYVKRHPPGADLSSEPPSSLSVFQPPSLGQSS
jgi:hypothetical protein